MPLNHSSLRPTHPATLLVLFTLARLTTPTKASSSSTLSPGAKAGISIGAIVTGLSSVILLAFLLLRQRQRRLRRHTHLPPAEQQRRNADQDPESRSTVSSIRSTVSGATDAWVTAQTATVGGAEDDGRRVVVVKPNRVALETITSSTGAAAAAATQLQFELATIEMRREFGVMP